MKNTSKKLNAHFKTIFAFTSVFLLISGGFLEIKPDSGMEITSQDLIIRGIILFDKISRDLYKSFFAKLDNLIAKVRLAPALRTVTLATDGGLDVGRLTGNQMAGLSRLSTTIGDDLSIKFVKEWPQYVDEALENTGGLYYVKGVEKCLKNLRGGIVGRSEKSVRGFTFELKVGNRYGAENIAEMSKSVRTKFDSTDIDVLLKDGTILESKSIKWNLITRDEYFAHKSDLGRKIKIFREYNPKAKIRVVFDKELETNFKKWLIEEKLVEVEVI